MTDFVRSVRFRAGYDCKNVPCKHEVKGEHGIAGVEMTMILLGEKGATQFKLLTNWYPSTVSMPSWMTAHDYRGTPADLGHHWFTPTYEDEWHSDYCDILHPDEPEKGCYYDGSGVAADRVFERLVDDGEDGVWDELERLYTSLAQPTEAVSW